MKYSFKKALSYLTKSINETTEHLNRLLKHLLEPLEQNIGMLAMIAY